MDKHMDGGEAMLEDLRGLGNKYVFSSPGSEWGGQAPSVETIYNTAVRGGQIAQRTPMGPVYVGVPIVLRLKFFLHKILLQMIMRVPGWACRRQMS